MLSDLKRDAAAETYSDTRGLLVGLCQQFQRTYGGDMDDLVSEAHEHFVDVFLSHNPSRGNIKSDLRFRVWHRLLETVETKARRKRLLPRVDLEDVPRTTPAPFDLEDFTAGLPPDAAEVVRIVFRSPPDVDLAIVQRGEPSPNNIRLALREYLKDLGWGFSRVVESFEDIRRALT